MYILRWLTVSSFLLVLGISFIKWDRNNIRGGVTDVIATPVAVEENDHDKMKLRTAQGKYPDGQVSATKISPIESTSIAFKIRTGGDLKKIDPSMTANNMGQAIAKSNLSNIDATNLLTGVPNTYSVSNAEAYFVIAENRYPGNLGGPPPLNLPSIIDIASENQTDTRNKQ